MNRDSKKSETEPQETKMLNYNEINNSDLFKYVNVLCMINSPPEDYKQEVTMLRVGEKRYKNVTLFIPCILCYMPVVFENQIKNSKNCKKINYLGMNQENENKEERAYIDLTPASNEFIYKKNIVYYVIKIPKSYYETL